MHDASPVADAAPILADFHRDGFALVRGAIAPATVARLRQLGEAVFADPAALAAARHGVPFVAARLYEAHPEFAAFSASEPIYGLMDALLGAGFQACGMNLIRNPPGMAIDRFHVDDTVEVPLPPEIAQHDPRVTMPVTWLTVQIPLSDIETVAHGPTEFVPGSHRSGRAPDDAREPRFAGRGPVPVLCRAGDLYLQNNQCWHRGAPNTSDRTRCLLQVQYARRWCAARFHPPLRAAARERVLARGDDRQRQVLGEVDVYDVPVRGSAYGA
ncbi:MAG TPA: phytanoyl-CoA dioxygenase family protein [Planctomycetota bacterium]|nr:phytanoyl-CoA dioxygenase family protein [Planctomycetota bacterium]